MATIKEILKQNNPTISDATLKGHDDVLRRLYKILYPEDKKNIDVEKFKAVSSDKLIEIAPISGKSYAYQKNVLCSIRVWTDDKSVAQMITAINKTMADQAKTQEPSETNIKNHVTPEQIDEKYNELYEKSKTYWDDLKTDLDLDKYMALQDFVMFALVSSKFVPVRRSRDYYDFKIKMIDLDKDNYLDKHDMVFNGYKSDNSYGQQRVAVPKELYNILRKWIRLNGQGYLFTNRHFQKLDASSFAKCMYRIWGRQGLSTNSMRHAKLQNAFPYLQNLPEINQTLADMGTSMGSVHHYIKKL